MSFSDNPGCTRNRSRRAKPCLGRSGRGARSTRRTYPRRAGGQILARMVRRPKDVYHPAGPNSTHAWLPRIPRWCRSPNHSHRGRMAPTAAFSPSQSHPFGRVGVPSRTPGTIPGRGRARDIHGESELSFPKPNYRPFPRTQATRGLAKRRAIQPSFTFQNNPTNRPPIAQQTNRNGQDEATCSGIDRPNPLRGTLSGAHHH